MRAIRSSDIDLVWLRGDICVVRVSELCEVTLRRARLVLLRRMVTVSVCNVSRHSVGSTQPPILSGTRNEYRPMGSDSDLQLGR